MPVQITEIAVEVRRMPPQILNDACSGHYTTLFSVQYDKFSDHDYSQVHSSGYLNGPYSMKGLEDFASSIVFYDVTLNVTNFS